MWIGIILNTIAGFIDITIPFLIQGYLEWIISDSPPFYVGVILGSLISLLFFLRVYCFRLSSLINYRASIQMYTLIPGQIMHKIQSFNQITLSYMGIGVVNSSVASFTFDFSIFIQYFNDLTGLPTMIIPLSAIFIYYYGLVGLVVPFMTVLILVLQILVSNFNSQLAIRTNREISSLNQSINQLINGMKHIKYNGWETIVLKNLMKAKRSTSFFQFLVTGIQFMLIIVSTMSPPIILLVLIYLMLWGDQEGNRSALTFSEAYFLISLTQIINYPIRLMTSGLNFSRNTFSSLKVFDMIMNFNQKQHSIEQESKLKKGSLQITNLAASWHDPISHANFKLKSKIEENQIFENLSFDFKPGKLYGIIGEVGSGKSSLLYACLSELMIKSGSIKLNGEIAYVPQVAFLINDTVRNNILFYKPYEIERYTETIVKCGLVEDLKNFKSGDLTEIGEKGINLSGGQKQRISLARAMYSKADICLIDDALSALDSELGQFVFQQVIKRAMSNQTRLLVTHADYLLEQMDEVILMKDGKIVQSGCFKDLGKTKEYQEYCYHQYMDQGGFDEKMSQYSTNSILQALTENNNQNSNTKIRKDSFNDIKISIPDERDRDSHGYRSDNILASYIYNSKWRDTIHKDGPKCSDNTDLDAKQSIEIRINKFKKKLMNINNSKILELARNGRITTDEIENSNLPSIWVFFKYIAYYGPILLLFNLLILTIGHFLLIVLLWFFAQWATLSLGEDTSYEFISVILLALITSLFFLYSFTNSFGVKLSTDRIFYSLLQNMLKKPMSFYDQTPIGQIMARLINDRASVAQEMGSYVMFVSFAVVQLLLILGLTVINSPLMLFVFLILLFLLAIFLNNNLRISIAIRKIQNLKKAPVISKITEAFRGSITFKAYKIKDKMAKELERRNDELINTYAHEFFANQSMFFISEIVGIAVVSISITTFSIIKILDFSYLIDPNRVAISLTQLMILAFWFTYNIFNLNMMMRGLTAVERMLQWSNQDGSETLRVKREDKMRINENWVVEGGIKVDRLNIRYRKGLPLVLRNLSFEIKPRQKVGVVGRTGSGKSTLILALKRILEPAEETLGRSNQITVDGFDLHAMGLWPCRRSMVLIPQDPYLLEGTIQFNVDPFGQFSQEQVISALLKTHVFESLSNNLKKYERSPQNVQKSSSGLGNSEKQHLSSSSTRSNRQSHNLDLLKYTVTDGGSNLSQGQKQLICIARAIIHKPKILLMDEATANIDKRTERVIQKLIETELRDSTLITIAHRIDTIIQYDKILFLKNGTLVEEGSPSTLLAIKGGLFRDLVMEGGIQFYEEMKRMTTNGFKIDH